MNVSILAAWLLLAMTSLAPPGRRTFIKAADESKEQALARYSQIAEVTAKVALDPNETPIISRKFTASLLLSLTFHESAGWSRDVDLDLARLKTSQSGWQDHGRAWCMGQHNLGLRINPDGSYDSATRTPEGWSGKDLVADREKCIRATLRAARLSFSASKSLPFAERLVVYASGNTLSQDGKDKSVRRIKLAKKLMDRPMPAEPALVSLLTP